MIPTVSVQISDALWRMFQDAEKLREFERRVNAEWLRNMGERIDREAMGMVDDLNRVEP